MTTVEQTVDSIRATLAEHSDDDGVWDELVAFEAELDGLVFDGADLTKFLDRWWGIAYLRANPVTADERATVARAREGDFTGLVEHTEDGGRRRL